MVPGLVGDLVGLYEHKLPEGWSESGGGGGGGGLDAV
jgi:hypothetical protein